MKNIKISVKLIALSIILSGITAYVGIYGLQNCTTINDGMTTMYKDRVIPLKQLGIIKDICTSEIYLSTRKARSHEITYTACMRQIDISLEKLKKTWIEYNSTYMDNEEKVILKDANASIEEVENSIYEIKTFLTQRDSVNFIKARENFIDISFKAGAIIDKLVQVQVNVAERINTDSDILYAATQRNTYSLIIACVIISLFLSFSIIKTISNSLKQATDTIIKVAAGNFSSKAENIGTDEIGLVLSQINLMIDNLRGSVNLANKISEGDLTMLSEIKQSDSTNELDVALKKMVINLNDIVENIINAANSILSASEEISTAAQQVAQGAGEQAASAEEVSASIEEIAASVGQNNENAQQAERIVLKSTNEIAESSRAVMETLKAMNEISIKISVINEIAQKTDLLALNAGIEAARAGVYGKGFTVVSNEVRKLAENSRRAATSIDTLITDSLKIAEKSNQLQCQLVPEIQKTSKLVQEISASSSEQSNGTNQINMAMAQLNQVTQQNAASSEELATSAEELSGQATQLVDMISFFKTDTKHSSIAGKQDKQEKQTKHNDQAKAGHKGVKIDLGGDSNDKEYESFS